LILFFRIEILQTSTRDTDIVNQEIEITRKMLDDYRVLTNRELIRQEIGNNSIDWTNISEILVKR
jgi:hypothetical protein